MGFCLEDVSVVGLYYAMNFHNILIGGRRRGSVGFKNMLKTYVRKIITLA